MLEQPHFCDRSTHARPRPAGWRDYTWKGAGVRQAAGSWRGRGSCQAA